MISPFNKELLEVLELVSAPTAALDNADDKERKAGPRFPGDRFFTEWFRNRGQIYFFLFKKNHRVTNIQVAELISLLRSYRTDSDSELMFLSVDGFKRILAHVAESFRDNSRGGRSKYELIAEKYSALIGNTAAIDVMFGSCLVYLPPAVGIDLKAICSRSGYIHSCGRNVYVRNLYKANKDEMFEKIDEYLDRYTHKRLLFRPFSHEDFTEFDRIQKDDLKSGLDDVKISVQKYFLREHRLASIIEDMRSRFKDRLVIPHPGDYHHDEALITAERTKSDFDSTRSLFLVMDHSMGGEGRIRGNRHFIICYDQEYINENPFHLFDENKPAWFDHTTLPHTLAGAMINITRPYWPQKSGPVLICDCFVGSGTTLLEAAKYDNTLCCGLDYEPISPFLVEDNIRFFSESASELVAHHEALSKVAEHLEEADHSRAAKHSWEQSLEGKALILAEQLLNQWKERMGQSPESSQELVQLLQHAGPLARLLFYTRLKVARRYEAAILTGSVSEEDALQKELVGLGSDLKQLIDLRGRGESGAEDGHRVTYQGSYSSGLSINRHYIGALSKSLPGRIAVGDCREWEPQGLFDVIVTDPPYGFNTNEDRQLLADVYSSFLRKAIDHLEEGGQLVLALPDWSHTGRQLPAFALKDFVAHQVLVVAEELKREVIHSGVQIPKTVGVPPYYWESEKALRRAILHFRFRKYRGYRRHVSAVGAGCKAI